MRPSSSPPGRPEPLAKIVANLGVVLLALAAVGYLGFHRPDPTPAPPPPRLASAPAPEPQPEPTPESEPAPPPPPPPAPTLDRAAIAQAEARLEAARRDRAGAEAREAAAKARLEGTATESARELSASRTLASRVRDPGARFASAMARGQRLKAERDRLQAELAALAGSPRPRRKALTDKSPVARPTDGEEFHFEVRRDRVAFIDLERLLERVKSDARMRIRLADGLRPVAGTVGPVGAFQMHYEMERSLPESLSEALAARGISYNLRAWEIVPDRDVRGESFEMATQPASDFARAVNRLSPSHATITLWIYPDGFPLYRRLRDYLHARGFLVAARPLPEGLPIRGSPAGSVSAGQ
jgi:hypothetical protein